MLVVNQNITIKKITSMADIEELLEMIAKDMGSQKIGVVGVAGAEVNSGEAIIKMTRKQNPDAAYPVMIIHRGATMYQNEGANHTRAKQQLSIQIVDKVKDRSNDQERRSKEALIQQTFEELLARLEYYANIPTQAVKTYNFKFDKVMLNPTPHVTVNNEVGWQTSTLEIGRMGSVRYFGDVNDLV